MLALIAAALCIAANAFFVAAEFALAKVRPTSLEAAAQAGDDDAKRALALVDRLDEYLAATQLGITIASLGLGWLGEPTMARLLEPVFEWLGVDDAIAHGMAFAVGFTFISALHIILGELVPKTLGITRAEKIAKKTARLMHAFYVVSYPALWILNHTSNFVVRLLHSPTAGHQEGKLSVEELRLMVAASLTDEGAAGQRLIIERVLRATDRPVRAIMIPRVDMQILDLERGLDEALRRIRQHGFSRYPVCIEDDPDRVVGYVYVKDLLFRDPDAVTSLAEIKRDILIVPESRTVGEILAEFQRTKIPIALVVDEYGGTSGLVTIEDALAEIVGDVNDELKGASQPRAVIDADGSWIIDGALPIGDLELEGLKLSDEEDVDTVGGYVVGRLGRLASPGDRVEVGDWIGTVEDVRRRRATRIRFRKRDAPARS